MTQPWSNPSIALLIVQAGPPPSGGIFLYNAAGQLVGSWVTQAGTDPIDGDAVAVGLTVEKADRTLAWNVNAGVMSWQNLIAPAFNGPFIQGQPAVAGCTLALDSGVGTGAATDAQWTLLDSLASGTGQPLLFGRAGKMTITEPDGNTYRTERLFSQMSADVSVTNTGGGQVLTGIADFPVAAGTYQVRGQIYWTQTTSNISQAIRFEGANAVANTRVQFRGWPQTGTGVSAQFIFGLIDNTFGNFGGTVAGGATVYCIDYQGIVTFSATDTFGIMGKASSAINNWVAKAGSWIELMPNT